MKIFIAILAIFALSGCAYFSDAVGLNYDTEADYRAAVDSRLADAGLDPAVEAVAKEKLYALWVKNRNAVLDAYELDDAIHTLIVTKLTD